MLRAIISSLAATCTDAVSPRPSAPSVQPVVVGITGASKMNSVLPSSFFFASFSTTLGHPFPEACSSNIPWPAVLPRPLAAGAASAHPRPRM